MIEPIITSRLILNPVQTNDADDLFVLYSNKNLLKYKDNSPHIHQNDTLQFINTLLQQLSEERCFFWTIRLHEFSNVIGTIALQSIDRYHCFATISCLLSQQHWCQGYMTESMLSVVNFAFNHTILNRIEAQVYIRNFAIIRVLEKLNFVREGHLRQNFKINNTFRDSYLYAILKQNVLKSN